MKNLLLTSILLFLSLSGFGQNQDDLKIEVETRNIEEVKEVLAVGGIHRIMLDNMLPSDMKEAVKMIQIDFNSL